MKNTLEKTFPAVASPKRVHRARFAFYDAFLQRQFYAGDIVPWPDERVEQYLRQGAGSPIIEVSEVGPLEVK